MPFAEALGWWFYQHGRWCAQHPAFTFLFGFSCMLACTAGLLNPTGRPWVFEKQELVMRLRPPDAWSPALAALYCLLMMYVTRATDSGVSSSLGTSRRLLVNLRSLGLRRLLSLIGARLVLGFAGVFTLLGAIAISLGVANSLLGVSFTNIWDEFPFLFVFLGVESVFNLLPPVGSHSRGSTVQVMASAASRGWPKYVPWAILKALMWLSAGAVTYSISGTSGQEALAMLGKLLLQITTMSVVVQSLLPVLLSANRVPGWLRSLTPDAVCRICLEAGPSVVRCPCRCSGSVGFIHLQCLEGWMSTLRSSRCELCGSVFQIEKKAIQPTRDGLTFLSFIGELLPPLMRVVVVLFGSFCVLFSNKLGVLLLAALRRVPYLVGASDGAVVGAVVSLALVACLILAVASVWARVLEGWYTRHREIRLRLAEEATTSG